MPAKSKPAAQNQPRVETFTDHQVITPPNPLRAAVRKVAQADRDDPVQRAERALEKLSGEFRDWMTIECQRLSKAHTTAVKDSYSAASKDALFRVAHDIKGEAATLGYPTAAVAAESLCRIIEHAPDLAKAPSSLIGHHIDAILAIVREQHIISSAGAAEEISLRLRSMADAYLVRANQDRPDHLDAIGAPGLVPDLPSR